MNTLKPVSRTTLSEQVAVQVVRMIAAGKWKPGEKLPSELDLCQAFNIGRSTLREALKSLAFVGMVRMRAGEGTFVADGPSKLMDRMLTRGLLHTEKDVSDLWETRMVLETELAALCAQRATDEDLASLDRLVSEMQRSVARGGEGFQELDVEFHLTIATCSKNQVLAQLLRTIRDLVQELIIKTQQIPGAPELAYAQHRAILEALKQHKLRKARSAMRTHLRAFERRFRILAQASESDSEARAEAAALAQR